MQELRADAALHGETIAQAAVRRARAAIEAHRPVKLSAQTWRRMSSELRAVLVSLGTARRDVDACDGMQWEQFSEAERVAMGAMAREFRRQLEGAGWLR